MKRDLNLFNIYGQLRGSMAAVMPVESKLTPASTHALMLLFQLDCTCKLHKYKIYFLV